MELNVLGLGDETEHVYIALIGHPRGTASQVAGLAGGSTASTARVLSTLVAMGLATRTGGRPPRFTAHPPDVAATALIQEREHQLDAARALVQRLAETHREANRISHPDIAVELLTQREDISQAAHRLTAEARHQVRAFDLPPYVDRPGSNLQQQLGRQRTGVVHRVIYSRAAVSWPGRLAGDILPSVRAGEQARVRGELPLKLIIRDDRAALIPFSLAAGGHAAAYLIHRSPMLAALEALFEAEWDRAVALGASVPTQTPRSAPAAGPEPSTAPPDPDTHVLLTLLTSGLTDAAIARTQGWSPRTTQRRIQRLMTALGATTRFQAALTAARRGWI
ncbi:Sugar-specific transcriptional regulator TrmB [Streptomyces sp. DvalAA-14]|uniref:helix-turn-helix domain-containing protein n=1 Tax=unclassified Streptomyces TaxID=2593676 RepID=UPI00081B26B0|nr:MULTISPECIES: helix-turn-helix domain-containing protein [unclassified Streptomyces]MYS18984.1 transcriptional regulator [Streptomyces sp. SID4948]SCD33290.1 Sugar-specific transcriptional regulator TrmB [Streptomyces sp. DvalAA-14]